MQARDTQKAAQLRMAIQNLQNAEAWVKHALGDTDVGADTQHRISELIEDLMYDVIELEAV